MPMQKVFTHRSLLLLPLLLVLAAVGVVGTNIKEWLSWGSAKRASYGKYSVVVLFMLVKGTQVEESLGRGNMLIACNSP